MLQKKNILMVYGIGDTFCDESSFRFLKAGEKLHQDVLRFISENKKKYSAIINVTDLNDKQKNVNPFDLVKNNRLINISLFEPKNTFKDKNIIKINPSSVEKGEVIGLSSLNFDYLFNPKEYNIFICGIDINGIFINTIDWLIEKGYFITVFSDSIKPYSKETITHIINCAKNKNNHLRFGKS